MKLDKKLIKKNFDKRNVIIIALVASLICSCSYTGYNQYQNMLIDYDNKIHESYETGLQDGFNSAIISILNQLNATGYVTLNIGDQIIHLQPVIPE